MKVRIGDIEVLDVTLDDLDQIVQRYGQNGHNRPEPKQGLREQLVQRVAARLDAVLPDMDILNRLLDAGKDGILITQLGEWVGKRGKAVRKGMYEWSKRIGLGDGDAAFENTRDGTKRGMRISDEYMDRAKEIVKRQVHN